MFEARLRWREMFPIVRRELLAAAKRRVTYRLRWIAALAAAGGVFAAANLADGFTVEVGQFVFWAASAVMIVVCGAAGLLLTADSISREKREGTLGLLFLTRLTSADVVLGKLTAGALNGSAVAFAALPFLAFSLCLGGVTASEFWVMSSALLLLLAYSLTLGIFISTLMRKEGFIGLMFCFLMLGPVGLTALALMKWSLIPVWIARVNPFFPALSLENHLLFPSELAWQTVAFQIIAIFGMLMLSFFVLPWTIKGVAVERKIKIRISSPRLLQWNGTKDRNPVYWLSRRHGHALVLLLLCVGVYFVVGFAAPTAWEAEATFLVLMALLPKLFVLWHASGMMADERQSGFLESLLTTPITGAEILRGKMNAIKWQVVPAMAFAMMGLWWTSTKWWATQGEITVGTTVGLAAMITLLIDMHSIGWVGLWQGLVARDRRRALLWSALWGLLAPWIPSGIAFMLIAWLFDGPRWMWDKENILAPMLISANVISFGIACFAMARLHDRFRSTATQTWSSRGGKALAAL